jgi:hypothetical protein
MAGWNFIFAKQTQLMFGGPRQAMGGNTIGGQPRRRD